MKLILLGPPGSGKGTQSRRICERYKVPQISTGEIFREAIRERTPLGLKAKTYINAGQLVPDQLVIDIIEDRISRQDCKNGFVLDGFPRTVGQAEALSKMANASGVFTISFQVNEDELVKRLSSRRTCKDCGTGYHLLFSPPKKEGKCDQCGGNLYQRDDDKPETIRKRLTVYKNQTAPVSEYYKKLGKLASVDGMGEVNKIFGLIEKAIEDLT
ncbi:adenylate kinase [bacterium]|nr:adenylate kinase [bacterium]